MDTKAFYAQVREKQECSGILRCTRIPWAMEEIPDGDDGLAEVSPIPVQVEGASMPVDEVDKSGDVYVTPSKATSSDEIPGKQLPLKMDLWAFGTPHSFLQIRAHV